LSVTLIEKSDVTLPAPCGYNIKRASIEKGRTMKRFGTGLLVLLTVLVFWTIFRQPPKSAPPIALQAAIITKPDSKLDRPVPAWAAPYEREFWRKSTQADPLPAGASAVNVQDVIDRVSHAFRKTDGSNPTVTARDYVAS